MFNNRKAASLLCLGALVPMLCSCSSGILSDAGTDISVQRNAEDYLDIGVLDNVHVEDSEDGTYTIIRGTFTKPGMDSTYDRDCYISYPVRAKVESGTMTYVSTEVYNGQVVKKGDTLAIVETTADLVNLEQTRLRLQRTVERHEEEQQNFEKEYEKRKADLIYIWDKYEYKSQTALLERWVLEWQNTCRDYEKQVSQMQKEVKRLEAYAEGSFRAITADRDGMVVFPDKMPKNGDTVENGRLLCSIIPLDMLIFSTSNNSLQSYRYGMDFTWSVNVKDGEPLEMAGSVVNGTEGDLYGNLRRGDGIFFLLRPTDEEAISDAEENIRDARIHGDQETMENVLLVPAQAVVVENDITYVTIVKEDGSFLKKGFTAGGSNANYYWVLDGLEEGTVILAEP